MKYTYEIKFGLAPYVSLTPGKNIMMDGFWEEGTKIWREQISELYITKEENTGAYNTLESWFEDETEFETQIFVKILKDGVQDSVHWFGVKWGTLNKDQTTYVVQPIVYDFWAQYFESTKDILSTDSTGPLTYQPYYYEDSGTYALIALLTNSVTIEDITKELSSTVTGWSSADVVSSFLWGDAYEDTSAVGTYQGMPLDYVTSKQSYLKYGGIAFKSSLYVSGKTFSDLLIWLGFLNVKCFFDSNDKLRYEHINFFNGKLTDNAVDFSSYIKAYDEEWSYLNPVIPVLEKVEIRIEEDDTDQDWQPTNIIYSDSRNRPDVQSLDYQTDLFSDIGYHGGSSIPSSGKPLIFGGLLNQVYKWFDISMTSFSSEFNAFDIVWDTGGGNDFCGSNDFRVRVGSTYAFTAQISAISGTFQAFLKERAGGTTISNKITVNSTGSTTGTLTPTGPADDGYLAIEGTVGSTGNATGWISAVGGLLYGMIPSADAIISGDPKTGGVMSVGNIIDSWWQDNRLSREATINGSDYDFNGTQYNLVRKDIRIYYAGVINPLYGFNDGTRIGMIDTWTRDLDTDYYTISLIYQEDT